MLRFDCTATLSAAQIERKDAEERDLVAPSAWVARGAAVCYRPPRRPIETLIRLLRTSSPLLLLSFLPFPSLFLTFVFSSISLVPASLSLSFSVVTGLLDLLPFISCSLTGYAIDSSFPLSYQIRSLFNSSCHLFTLVPFIVSKLCLLAFCGIDFRSLSHLHFQIHNHFDCWASRITKTKTSSAVLFSSLDDIS